MLLLIKKVSPTFTLTAGTGYNVKHWPNVTHIGINIEKSTIAFFNVSGGTLEQGYESASGWKYWPLQNNIEGLKIIQTSPRLFWEYIPWPYKELARGLSMPEPPVRELEVRRRH